MAVASVGLLHLWGGYGDDFAQIMKLMNSSDKYVRAGAVLALGVSASGTRPDGFDYVHKLIGPIFNPYYYAQPAPAGDPATQPVDEQRTPVEDAAAALPPRVPATPF